CGTQRRRTRSTHVSSPKSATTPPTSTSRLQGPGTRRASAIASNRTIASGVDLPAPARASSDQDESGVHPIRTIPRDRGQGILRCSCHPTKGDRMAELIAIGYPDETTAADAEREAHHLAEELIIQPDAIASIVRDKDGKFR